MDPPAGRQRVSFTIDIAGRHVPWTLLLLAAVALVWLIFAALSMFSRAEFERGTLRTSDRNLVVSSLALLLAWGVAFDALSLVRSKANATQASAMAKQTTSGSCATLKTGMSAQEVTWAIGKADEVRNDEKMRGPGTETWLYRASRCSVHLLDGKVEVVD
jgi:hypothetical protein